MYHSPINIEYEMGQVIKIEQTIQNLLNLAGYQHIETPLVEALDLFLTKAGSQFIERLLVFDQHDTQFALRPEFTVSALLRYISQNVANKPVRWQLRGPVFQMASSTNIPQYAQRYSIGAEIIGADDRTADAEIISLATQVLTALDIQDWTLIIGDLGIFRTIVNALNLDTRIQRFLLDQRTYLHHSAAGKALVLENLDHLLANEFTNASTQSVSDISQAAHTRQMLDVLLDTTRRGQTMGGRTRQDIAERLLNKQQRLSERDKILQALDFLEQWVNIEGTIADAMEQMKAITPTETNATENWTSLFELLKAYDVDLNRVRIKPDLARTWDYYTGLVFEIRAADDSLLVGGGRYDELARLVGSKVDIPAVGFAVYVDNVLEHAQNQYSSKIAISIAFNNADAVPAIHWATALRQKRIAVELILSEAITNDTFSIMDNQLQMGNTRYSMTEIDAVIEKLTNYHD